MMNIVVVVFFPKEINCFSEEDFLSSTYVNLTFQFRVYPKCLSLNLCFFPLTEEQASV